MYFNVGCLSLDRWCVSSQARKLGEKKTVEALARQFQDQIERIMMEKSVVSAQSHIPSRYSTVQYSTYSTVQYST